MVRKLANLMPKFPIGSDSITNIYIKPLLFRFITSDILALKSVLQNFNSVIAEDIQFYLIEQNHLGYSEPVVSRFEDTSLLLYTFSLQTKIAAQHQFYASIVFDDNYYLPKAIIFENEYSKLQIWLVEGRTDPKIIRDNALINDPEIEVLELGVIFYNGRNLYLYGAEKEI